MRIGVFIIFLFVGCATSAPTNDTVVIDTILISDQSKEPDTIKDSEILRVPCSTLNDLFYENCKEISKRETSKRKKHKKNRSVD